MPNARQSTITIHRSRGRALLSVIALAAAVVALLLFVKGSDWFQVRPVSGAANAMAQAAVPPADGAPPAR